MICKTTLLDFSRCLLEEEQPSKLTSKSKLFVARTLRINLAKYRSHNTLKPHSISRQMPIIQRANSARQPSGYQAYVC